ncbi:hypothetical protein [Nocardia fluminea]|uniref:hypothetical protein n=1 Tax=Nocardia fluminea TaxID=134984 RepID=UPI0036561732
MPDAIAPRRKPGGSRLIVATTAVAAVVVGAVLIAGTGRGPADSADAAPGTGAVGTTVPSVTRLSTTVRPAPTTARPISTTVPSPRAPTGPEATVLDYFAAVNRRDYSTAWALGGRNLDTDFGHFAGGFATTDQVRVTIFGVDGNQVHTSLDAVQTDGRRKAFTGFYEVRDGVIVAARMREV